MIVAITGTIAIQLEEKQDTMVVGFKTDFHFPLSPI